jgi:hypothetical protein
MDRTSILKWASELKCRDNPEQYYQEEKKEMAGYQRGKVVRMWKRLESFHSLTHINGNNVRKLLIREVTVFLSISSSDSPAS